MFTQVSFNIVVGLLVRGVLLMAAGWLVAHGILPQGNVEEWVGAAVLAVCGLGWSYYTKYAAKQQQDTLIATAIQMPPSTTVADVHATVADGLGVTTTAKNLGVPIVLLALLLPFLSGCAPTMKAKLQQVDVSVYGTLGAIDAYENDLYVHQTLCGSVVCVDAAGHKKFSHDFLIAVQAGKTFHVSLMAWKFGQPVPIDVINVSAGLKAAAETLKTAFADGPGKTTLAALIDAGALAVNQALVLILPQQQATDLMPRALVNAVH